MKVKVWCFLVVAFVNTMSWVPVASENFPPFHSVYQKGRGQFLESPQASFVSKQGELGGEGMGRRAQKEEEEGLNRVGSRPPNCEHKCRGCTPCNAIQVPTTSSGHFRVQYANYEPEGWKCKCGSFFFNP